MFFVILESMQRVAVFIDHSNVYHNLRDADWPVRIKTYNPLFVAQRLAGGRELVKVMFYCSAPPPTLQATNLSSYELQERYLSEVAKLENVEVRYANLIPFRWQIS